jgi:hypothetical protein
MSRWVALLFSVCLVGCSATTRGLRPGTGQNTLRSGLPVAPGTPPRPMPLQGVAGEGLGNGLPRAVLRLVPQGATTAAEAGTGAATGEALVAGGALVAAGGSVAKDNPLGRLFHDAATKKWGQLHPYTGG